MFQFQFLLPDPIILVPIILVPIISVPIDSVLIISVPIISVLVILVPILVLISVPISDNRIFDNLISLSYWVQAFSANLIGLKVA